MNCSTCPNCGYDLTVFEHFRQGDLDIIANAAVYWRGTRVELSANQRLVVAALAKAGGAIVNWPALAEVIDTASEDPANIVAVTVCQARTKFRLSDPSFDRIRSSGGHGYKTGLRWVVEDDQMNQLHRATARQRQLHKLMLCNPGATLRELQDMMGITWKNALDQLLAALKERDLVRRRPGWRGWEAVGSLELHEQLEASRGCVEQLESHPFRKVA